jgi:NAD(P)-dependent dehydrogenase (short-subunit alcohol dehydrogenase family)
MNDRAFTGRTALVTGGGGGIGRAVAERLAAHGAQVAVADVALDPAREVVRAIVADGGGASAYAVDVRSPRDLDATLERIERAAGPVTLLVAAAGVLEPTPFLELSEEAWRRTVDVNLTGVFLTIQSVARRLVAAGLGGRMVAISSVSGRGPRPDSADYAASKAGVISVVRSAAVALAPHGIRVNAVCPGVVEGAMTERLHAVRGARLGISSKASLGAILESVALGRAARPQEVADVIAYLLSDASSYVIGQAVNVCGGLAFD